MRKIFFVIAFVMPLISMAQFGVAYHQSGIPFVSVNYEINERLRPELRILTDAYWDMEHLEGTLNYNVLAKPDYSFYVGGGYNFLFESLVFPVGLNFYPFEPKKLGFHIEVTPFVSDDLILRGSWGIRYRFKR